MRIPIANPAVNRRDLSVFPAELFSRTQVFDLYHQTCMQRKQELLQKLSLRRKYQGGIPYGINAPVHPDSY